MAEEIKSDRPSQTFLSNINPAQNTKGLLILLVAIILVIGGAAYSLVGERITTKREPSPTVSPFSSISDNSVVYGFWEGKSSYINAFDLKTGKIYNLAELPSNIKKVTVLDREKILFISNTDIRDHGKEIAVYSSTSNLTTPVVIAAEDFGIDDYVISPNKRYLATWEVSIPPNSTLLGSKSRVYAIDLNNPSVKNLLYDEVVSAGFAVHYPLAITDLGEVFLDRFEANTDAGWANGMSVSNLSGTIKQELDSMKKGTYSTQPVLSPDGTFLAFAGYDKSRGEDQENELGVRSEGFRKAILNPNTIEILDVSTKQRTRLSGLSNQDRYPYIAFDMGSRKILYSRVSKTASENGWYLYNKASSTSMKFDITRIKTNGLGEEPALRVLATLSNNMFLVANQDTSASALGNLGEKYGSSLTHIVVYDPTSSASVPLGLNQGLFQYISLLPGQYFEESKAEVSGVLKAGKAGAGQQLQLQTFTLKPELEPQRIRQQSLPTCEDYVSAQCNAMLGTNYPPDEPSGGEHDPAYDQCIDEQEGNASESVCSDSPLYLYGPKGTQVNIKVGTQVFGSNADYNGYYSGILTGNGGINISGKTFSSIDFDYIPAIKRLPRLDYGKTVASNRLREIIDDYGRKLGLSETEIRDLVSSIGTIDAPYVFVSFFDEETSKAILPIWFNPAPDVYRNVVFYLRPVEVPAVAKTPVFDSSPERRGFTAVEVSFILDK